MQITHKTSTLKCKINIIFNIIITIKLFSYFITNIIYNKPILVKKKIMGLKSINGL